MDEKLMMQRALNQFLVSQAGRYAPTLEVQFLPDSSPELAYTNYKTAYICGKNHSMISLDPIVRLYHYAFRKGLAIHEGGHPLFTDYKSVAKWFDDTDNRKELCTAGFFSYTIGKVREQVPNASDSEMTAAIETVFAKLFFGMVNTIEDGHLERRILAECKDNSVLGPFRFMRLVFQKKLIADLTPDLSLFQSIMCELLQLALYDEVKGPSGHTFWLAEEVDVSSQLRMAVNAKAPRARLNHALNVWRGVMGVCSASPFVVNLVVSLLPKATPAQKNEPDKDEQPKEEDPPNGDNPGRSGAGDASDGAADPGEGSGDDSGESKGSDSMSGPGEGSGDGSGKSKESDSKSNREVGDGNSPAAESTGYENPVPEELRDQPAVVRAGREDDVIDPLLDSLVYETLFSNVDSKGLTKEEVETALRGIVERETQRDALIKESHQVKIMTHLAVPETPPESTDMLDVCKSLKRSYCNTKQSSSRPNGFGCKIVPSQRRNYTVIDMARQTAMQVTSQLESALAVLENGEYAGGMYTGCALDMESIITPIPSGIFYDPSVPRETLDVSVTLLVDCSGSMIHDGRNTAAVSASLIMYFICNSLQVPITVGGFDHSFYHCIDASIPDDGFAVERIAGLEANGSTFEAPFLLWQGNRLLARPEERKILFLVSDGQPTEDFARAELCAISRHLEASGVELVIASIGDDKETLKEIYGDGRFLDISDPQMMIKVLPDVLLESIRNKL